MSNDLLISVKRQLAANHIKKNLNNILNENILISFYQNYTKMCTFLQNFVKILAKKNKNKTSNMCYCSNLHMFEQTILQYCKIK